MNNFASQFSRPPRSTRPEHLITEWMRSLRKHGLTLSSMWGPEQGRKFALGCFCAGLESVDGNSNALDKGQPVAERLNRYLVELPVHDMLQASAWPRGMFTEEEWAWLCEVFWVANNVVSMIQAATPATQMVDFYRRELHQRDALNIELAVSRAEMVQPSEASAYRAFLRGYLESLVEFGHLDPARMVELAAKAEALLPRPRLVDRLRELLVGPRSMPILQQQSS